MNPFAALIDVLLPRTCHICGESLLAHERFVCLDCLEKLPVTGYEKYWGNKTAVNSDLNPMETRFAGLIPMERACAPYFYTRDSALATLVHDFKYRGFSRLAAVMGELGAKALLPSGLFDGVEMLLPVPLHWRKKLKRGYNQTEMLAEGISKATGIPVSTQLKAVKPHRTQTSLTPEQRAENTRGVFELKSPESVHGKRVMLVDDICTTGATLQAASQAVVEATNHDVKIRLFTLGVV